MTVKFCLRLPKVPSSADLGNGLQFHVEFPKGTVILIHGLTGTPKEVKYLATHLQRNGYSVICPRLARHGEPMHILKYGKWHEFYKTVKDVLAKIPKEDTVFVGGLSMGALLGLLLAEEFPDRVSGAVCFSPTLFYDGWNVPWSRHLLPLAYYTPIRYFAYHKEEPPYGIKNERIRRRVHNYYEKAVIHDASEVSKYGYPYFPVTLYCELRKVINRVKERLPRVKAPVLMVQAYEDDMTSIKNSKYIYDHVGSSKKEIMYLYDSYHVITADQERGKAAQKMVDFFDESLPHSNQADALSASCGGQGSF